MVGRSLDVPGNVLAYSSEDVREALSCTEQIGCGGLLSVFRSFCPSEIPRPSRHVDGSRRRGPSGSTSKER